MSDVEGAESTASEVTAEDLDLISALDVGEGGEDDGGDKEGGKVRRPMVVMIPPP